MEMKEADIQTVVQDGTTYFLMKKVSLLLRRCNPVVSSRYLRKRLDAIHVEGTLLPASHEIVGRRG
ncbi:hypothetical protein PsorP6_001685 [Peronosclerospora sorghi]|uniref:Uncharacterized protein n=1 Tax=Peronosclerospora sorghi TaxID=230839 RepID=A0ACC0WW50_9STRA|nr:hypothetical protein PsorP6_001685 [Peronosclerospora sorghi]